MIFVTVGTTPFDELIEYIDNLEIEDEIILQISNEAKYIPKKKNSFKFTKNINDYYEKADIIISHAGAGSIYNLLEKNKKIIIIPNLSRVDTHQLDITQYMQKENYAITCQNINQLDKIIKNIDSYKLKKYEKDVFFKAHEIKDLLKALY